VGDFKVQGDIHNTYLQFLFENGIFTFLALLFLFIIPSVYNFIRSSKIFYVFIPAMVIPYFENNLNAGQFLFFPFVLCFIYLSISKLNFKNT
jgi:O-antigen ligase